MNRKVATMARIRKIIHVDMDAFYASIELREHPELAEHAVVVAYDAPRSVICAASYPARKFGLHSAMPLAQAKKICPQMIVLPPRFALYRDVSRQIHRIFAQYTELIEPLSLDEAYLDVTADCRQLHSATETAQRIRADIYRETELTASAGVAPNKFLAKIASDWHKPNGQFVIAPQQVMAFLDILPVEKVPGVGQVTARKMQQLQIRTVADLRNYDPHALHILFGQYGLRLAELAQGIDRREVCVNRIRKQISAEHTLAQDQPLATLRGYLPDLAQQVWRQVEKRGDSGCCVTLKLKTAEFRVINRSRSSSSLIGAPHELVLIGEALMENIPNAPDTLYRLIGIGLSDLHNRHAQGRLFD